MKVLIPVSDHVFGNAITEFVLSHQWPTSTQFKIVYVVEPISFGSVEAMYTLDKVFSDNQKFGRELTESISSALRKKFVEARIETVVLTGMPRNVILAMARDWKAEMIVMGSHGRKGFDRLILGSVSQAIIAHAPCSVAIIRVPHPEQLDIELSQDDLPEQIRELSEAK